ncbi:hypothetical protein BAE44_0017181 [Dichanthelium oligosanthes]|uniref:F-box domain-containing protein n=1 Tax=Dichanthelium oligosanthes TaxID=888268 RepID=A0A1E5V9Q9_9POAL|nr:hypothetical protein BAE44_0017181 [Dichanthelium oligosanthes]
MSPRKPEATATPARELPLDLLLEIVARSDAATLLPCAACCKALRRGTLSPAFIRRVCHRGPAGAAVVPPRLLRFLQSFYSTPVSFSLAHPPTPAAARLSEKHLAPSLLSRGAAAGLLERFEPVTSRGGLVVLRLHHHCSDVPL